MATSVLLQITSLSRVNHKNFVNLLGYCQEEQPFTRMMVFEYAPNGTLFEHLHGNGAESLQSEKTATWTGRRACGWLWASPTAWSTCTS